MQAMNGARGSTGAGSIRCYAIIVGHFEAAARRSVATSRARAVLDRYPAGLVAVAVAVFVLSAIDAGLTLTMIERGSVTESNPVMNVLLLFDVRLFVGSKILITGAGVISLVMYSRLMMFGRLRLRRFLNFILLFYILLIGYELTLLSMS